MEGYSALFSYVPKLQLGTLMVYGTCPLGVKEMVQHVDVTGTCTWKGVLMPVGATSATLQHSHTQLMLRKFFRIDTVLCTFWYSNVGHTSFHILIL